MVKTLYSGTAFPVARVKDADGLARHRKSTGSLSYRLLPLSLLETHHRLSSTEMARSEVRGHSHLRAQLRRSFYEALTYICI